MTNWFEVTLRFSSMSFDEVGQPDGRSLGVEPRGQGPRTGLTTPVYLSQLRGYES